MIFLYFPLLPITLGPQINKITIYASKLLHEKKSNKNYCLISFVNDISAVPEEIAPCLLINMLSVSKYFFLGIICSLFYLDSKEVCEIFILKDYQ